MARRKPVPSQEALSKADGGMKYDDDKEYGEDGKMCKGGGYRMSKGKLTKMEMKDDDYKKSEDLTQDDLEKSLAKLEEYAETNDHVSRKDALLEKASSEDLEKSERDELFNLLGGETVVADEAGLEEEMLKSLQDNETIGSALDVSEFLQEQHGELVKSLGVLAQHQEQSDNRQHEFNIVLAKAVADVGNLVKAMSEQVEVTSAQPARAPKSHGVSGAAPLQKSFAGQPAAGEALSKSQMAGGLEKLMHETMDKSGDTRMEENGVDLLIEISKFEQTGQLHPAVAQLVEQRVRTAAL